MTTISSNFGVAALSRLILGGISLIIVGLLTRALGPEGYGHYSLIFAYLFIFTTLADLGLYSILVREVSRRDADEKLIVSNVLSLRLFALLLFLVIGNLTALFLNYPIEVKLGILVASIFSIFSSLVQLLTGIFQKHLKLYYVSLADVAARGVQLGLVFWAVRNGNSLSFFIWAVVFSEIVHFLLIFWFSRRLVRVGLSFDIIYWRKIATTTLPVAVSLVFVLLYFKLDTVLLSLLRPAYDVGVYSAAYKVLETIIFFPAIYLGLVMPLMSRHALDDRKSFKVIFKKSFDVLSIFAVPTMVFIYLRAADIINLIGGAQFVQSISILRILSVAIFLIFFGNLGGNALIALDLQKKGMWIYFVGAIFNIGANIFFIPKYSYYAAAGTTVVTELLVTILLFWLIKKETGVMFGSRVFLKSLLAAIITVAMVHPLHFSFIWATLASLIYFPVLYLLGGIKTENLREV